MSADKGEHTMNVLGTQRRLKMSEEGKKQRHNFFSKNGASAEVTKNAELKATIEIRETDMSALAPSETKYSSAIRNTAENSLKMRFCGLPEISN